MQEAIFDEDTSDSTGTDSVGSSRKSFPSEEADLSEIKYDREKDIDPTRARALELLAMVTGNNTRNDRSPRFL
jgi:hypothetical protein